MKMRMIIIAFVLLIVLNLINLFNHVIRRRVMLGFDGLTLKSFLSPKLWFTLFTNPWVLLIIGMSVLLFVINLMVLNFIGVNYTQIFSFSLLIPFLLITICVSYIFLGEQINPAQYKYIGLLIISILISFFAVWGFVKNGV